MYVTESQTGASECVLCFLVSLHWREKSIREKECAHVSFAHSRISTRKSFHACSPRVLTRVSETKGTCVRSYVRSRERGPHARTRRRVEYTLLTPGSLRFSARYPAVRKALFSPPYVGTHARARTHRRRRRRIAVGVHAHGREPPPRLKILKRRGVLERGVDHTRGRSLRAFAGLSFTRVVASLRLPATAGRHSTATTTPALPRYHYPHLSSPGWAGRARPVPYIYSGEKHGAAVGRLCGVATRGETRRGDVARRK